MKNNENIREKLSIGPDGKMESTKIFKGTDKLPRLKGTPAPGTVAIQKLTDEDIVTKAGIILPGNSEFRGVVVAVGKGVDTLVIGDVVALAPTYGNIPLSMIEGEPISLIYPSTIIWIYEEKITDYKD